VEFAYRELGTNNPGIPVVFLVHLAAVLDNWDPRVVDGFAASRHVITFDNRGIGASSGAPATSIEQMAKDAITFIKAMGFERVDLFGFSMGGMIAQEIVLMEPPASKRHGADQPFLNFRSRRRHPSASDARSSCWRGELCSVESSSRGTS
jgi:pimeloyl-ACP methyl ester carboxylesterase